METESRALQKELLMVYRLWFYCKFTFDWVDIQYLLDFDKRFTLSNFFMDCLESIMRMPRFVRYELECSRYGVGMGWESNQLDMSKLWTSLLFGKVILQLYIPMPLYWTWLEIMRIFCRLELFGVLWLCYQGFIFRRDCLALYPNLVTVIVLVPR